MLNRKLSLVLPAHNEAENVEIVLNRIESILPELVCAYEVIVVDDGSSDATAEIIDRVASHSDHIVAVHHVVNRGYGAALRSGFGAASGDLIMFMDSDRQFDIADIIALLPYVPYYDIVAGYRIQRSDALYRRVYARIFDLSVLLLFGLRIHDIDCAFKIYNADLIRSMDLTMPGALINTEMLALAKRRGASIVQVGVHHYPRSAGVQSGGSPRVVFRAMGETIRLWWRLRTMDWTNEIVEDDQESGFGQRLNLGSIAAAVTAFIVLLAIAYLVRRARSGDDKSDTTTVGDSV